MTTDKCPPPLSKWFILFSSLYSIDEKSAFLLSGSGGLTLTLSGPSTK